MLFEIDFTKTENNKEYQVLPNGEWETIINAIENKLDTEKAHLVLELTVRKDVPQTKEGFGGTKIWDRFWFHTPASQDVSLKRLSQLIKVTGGKQGKLDFETLKNMLLAQPVRVKTKQTIYNEKTYVNVQSYLTSAFNVKSPVETSTFQSPTDEDLPF